MLSNAVRALLVGAVLAVGGCATITGPDGTQTAVVVGCEATSPAKSVGCATATLKALTATTEQQLKVGRISLDTAKRLQARGEEAYALIVQATELLALGDSGWQDSLSLAEELLLIIEDALKAKE